MTSELRSAASRANGAKSKGPKTAEGREKSSRNSLNHGFTSKKPIVLKCENEGYAPTVPVVYSDTSPPTPAIDWPSPSAAWLTSRAPFRSPPATNHVSIASTNAPTVHYANYS